MTTNVPTVAISEVEVMRPRVGAPAVLDRGLLQADAADWRRLAHTWKTLAANRGEDGAPLRRAVSAALYAAQVIDELLQSRDW
jgi:hypothetical protein